MSLPAPIHEVRNKCGVNGCSRRRELRRWSRQIFLRDSTGDKTSARHEASCGFGDDEAPEHGGIFPEVGRRGLHRDLTGKPMSARCRIQEPTLRQGGCATALHAPSRQSAARPPTAGRAIANQCSIRLPPRLPALNPARANFYRLPLVPARWRARSLGLKLPRTGELYCQTKNRCRCRCRPRAWCRTGAQVCTRRMSGSHARPFRRLPGSARARSPPIR